MSQENYKSATRSKIRFASSHGTIAVEDLWDISLAELKRIGNKLHSMMKSSEEDVFAEDPAAEDIELQLRFDIVKDVVETRQAEAKARTKEKDLKAKKDRILAIISDKQDDELKGKSLAELEKELEDL